MDDERKLQDLAESLRSGGGSISWFARIFLTHALEKGVVIGFPEGEHVIVDGFVVKLITDLTPEELEKNPLIVPHAGQ